MAADPSSPSADAVKQLLQAFEASQAKLALLKEQVEHAAALAQARAQGLALERELDRAYRDLGEAVWKELERGTLSVPPALAGVRAAVEAVGRQVQAHRASLGTLLSEGEALAGRVRENEGGTSKTMASNPKKR